jgi:hypothetical protein
MMRKASTIGAVTLARVSESRHRRPRDRLIRPSCFGQSIATIATGALQALGTFASEAAAFFNETGGSIGQVGVPRLKDSCVS